MTDNIYDPTRPGVRPDLPSQYGTDATAPPVLGGLPTGQTGTAGPATTLPGTTPPPPPPVTTTPPPVTHTPPPETDPNKGPMRRRLDGYLSGIDQALAQLAEAEASWRASGDLLDQIAGDLKHERGKLHDGLGGRSETATVASTAFHRSSEELHTKADKLRQAADQFALVRTQLDEARVERETMEGRAAGTSDPGQKPTFDHYPPKNPEQRQQLRDWQTKRADFDRMQGEQELRAEKQVAKIDHAYTDASRVLRSIHTDPTDERPEDSARRGDQPVAGGSVGPQGGGGLPTSAIAGGVLGGGALAGLSMRAVRGSTAMSVSTPSSAAAIGAGGRSGGAGVLGGAGTRAGVGGMPLGARGGAGMGGGRGVGRGGRGGKRDMWDDGEDWTDDEGLGPEVMQ